MIKKIILTLGTLVFIVIAAALVTPFFIPAEKFKGIITQYAQHVVGHPVKIGGVIRFKAFPFVGIYVENVTIGPPADKNGIALAYLKSLSIEIETLAALTGNIIIERLSLDTPQINLVVDSAGKSNWEGAPSASSHYTQSDVDGVTIGIESELRNLALNDVSLEEGYISYKNMQSKEAAEFSNINLHVSLEELSKPFHLKGDGVYRDRKVSLSGTVESLQTYLQNKTAKLHLTLAGELMNMEVKGTLDNTVYRGSTGISSASLISAMEWLTGKPRSINMVSALPLQFSSNAVCSKEACKFQGAKFNLDTIEAVGDVGAKFSGAVPYVDMKLTANEIDFNLFKPKEQPTAGSIVGSAHAATPESWSDEVMDFSALRNIELLANIETAGIRMNNIKIGKTILRAKIQRARLSMDIVDAVFYGGKASITANVDASGKSLNVDKRINFSGIQMEPLLKDAEISDRYSGLANLHANVVTSGNTEREMISNLQGAGSVKSTDGSIKGINIAQMVRNVQSAFKQVDTSGQKTDFTEAGGTFTITKGVVANKDLMMKAPLFRVKGEGQVDLPARTINYRLIPEIVETIQGQGGKEKEGLAVPVIIQGTIDNPTYRPDLESTIREAIQNPEKVKETIKDVKEQIKENKGDLKNILKDKEGLQNLLKKL